MRNTNDFIQVIKKAAADVYAQMKPADICTGVVASADPLTVRLPSGLELPADLLVTVGSPELTAGASVAVLRQSGGRSYYILGVSG